MRVRTKIWILLVFSAPPLHARLVIEADKTQWATLPTEAFFKKASLLIENRANPRLRGILTQTYSGKAIKGFTELKRVTELCKNIPASYSATKNHTVVKAQVQPKGIPHCRIQVKDGDGLVIDQILIAEKDAKRKDGHTTHTLTFFYPVTEDEKGAAAVKHFLQTSLHRRADE